MQNENEYKLYDVKIFKSNTKEGTWVGIKEYVTQKDIEFKRYQALKEESDSNGNPYSTGSLFFDEKDLEKLDTFKNAGTYDLIMTRNEKDEIKLVSGTLSTFKKTVIELEVSPLRQGGSGQQYCFLNVYVPETELDSATNKDEIIAEFEKLGLKKAQTAFNGRYSFGYIYQPWKNKRADFVKWENQKKHLEILLKENSEGIRLKSVIGDIFIGNRVMEVTGRIQEIEDRTLEVVMFTSWDELKVKTGKQYGLTNFTSVIHETLENPTEEGHNLKLTFRVNVKEGEAIEVAVGDEITFEISKENTLKILTPKIEISLGGAKEEVISEDSTEEEVENDKPKKTTKRKTPKKEDLEPEIQEPDDSEAFDENNVDDEDIPF